MAETLEVSERTIYRDIAHLIGAGLPIEGAAGMGYLMRPGYDLPPLMFDADEIVALIAGARMVSTFGGTAMAQGADRALDKIAAILPPPLRARAEAVAIRSVTARPLDAATRAAIDALERACEARQRSASPTATRPGQILPASCARWGFGSGARSGHWWHGANCAMISGCSA